MKITFIGQSSFKIELDSGAVVLTDPWFGGYPLLRARRPALGPNEIGDVKLILVSHNHIDHIDRRALRLALEKSSIVAGPPSVAHRAKVRGIEAVSLALRKDYDFGGLNVHTVPADHPLCSSPFGYLIQGDGKTLYFSGDTRNFPALRSALKGRSIDVALLQIACARYFGKPDGMDVHSAADLAREIHPKCVVPMHYHARFKEADPRQFKETLTESGIHVQILEPGVEAVL
ncbi:MAG: MBL fold metallo-hydrolase [Nitrospirae bacterium]|nr:MBL fold metallo-hydrolase [Nitrospirota bacterium]